MGLLDGFEKLINEHGSATILRERIALAEDKYSMLQEKNKHLSERNELLESKLKQAEEEIARLSKILETFNKNQGIGQLNEIEEKILQYLFKIDDCFYIEDIASIINSDTNTAKYHVNNLLDKKLIIDLLAMGAPTRYKISKNGIKHVVESKDT